MKNSTKEKKQQVFLKLQGKIEKNFTNLSCKEWVKLLHDDPSLISSVRVSKLKRREKLEIIKINLVEFYDKIKIDYTAYDKAVCLYSSLHIMNDYQFVSMFLGEYLNDSKFWSIFLTAYRVLPSMNEWILLYKKHINVDTLSNHAKYNVWCCNQELKPTLDINTFNYMVRVVSGHYTSLEPTLCIIDELNAHEHFFDSYLENVKPYYNLEKSVMLFPKVKELVKVEIYKGNRKYTNMRMLDYILDEINVNDLPDKTLLKLNPYVHHDKIVNVDQVKLQAIAKILIKDRFPHRRDWLNYLINTQDKISPDTMVKIKKIFNIEYS